MFLPFQKPLAMFSQELPPPRCWTGATLDFSAKGSQVLRTPHGILLAYDWLTEYYPLVMSDIAIENGHL